MENEKKFGKIRKRFGLFGKLIIDLFIAILIAPFLAVFLSPFFAIVAWAINHDFIGSEDRLLELGVAAWVVALLFLWYKDVREYSQQQEI